jgi:hypothetical protein
VEISVQSHYACFTLFPNVIASLDDQIIAQFKMSFEQFLIFVQLYTFLQLHLYNGLPEGWVACHVNIYTHYPELMKSLGCHGNSSLPLIMKVMII